MKHTFKLNSTSTSIHDAEHDTRNAISSYLGFSFMLQCCQISCQLVLGKLILTAREPGARESSEILTPRATSTDTVRTSAQRNSETQWTTHDLLCIRHVALAPSRGSSTESMIHTQRYGFCGNTLRNAGHSAIYLCIKRRVAFTSAELCALPEGQT